MKGLFVLVVLAGTVTIGCGKDPTRDVKIVERPQTTTTAPIASGGAAESRPETGAAPAAKPPAAAEFHLDACPPLPEEGAKRSNLTVTGPCAFEQRAAVSCEAMGDDFLIVLTRKTRTGGTVMVYVNVEAYAGPGKYKRAQMFVGVQDKVNIWKWSDDDVNITVGPGEAFADLPPTRLPAEPVLVNCTGPMTNFQCEGRDLTEGFDESVVTVSGRLQCDADRKVNVPDPSNP